MNYFRNYISQTDDRMIMKMDHYLDIYDKLLRDWQGRDVSFWKLAFTRVDPSACGAISGGQNPR